MLSIHMKQTEIENNDLEVQLRRQQASKSEPKRMRCVRYCNAQTGAVTAAFPIMVLRTLQRSHDSALLKGSSN